MHLIPLIVFGADVRVSANGNRIADLFPTERPAGTNIQKLKIENHSLSSLPENLQCQIFNFHFSIRRQLPKRMRGNQVHIQNSFFNGCHFRLHPLTP